MSPTGAHACFGRRVPSTPDWTHSLGQGRLVYAVSAFSYSFKRGLLSHVDPNHSSCIYQAAFESIAFHDCHEQSLVSPTVWVTWFLTLSVDEKLNRKEVMREGEMKERVLERKRERERSGWGGNLTLCYNFSHADCICLLHFTIVPDSSGIPACLTTAQPTQQHQTGVKWRKKNMRDITQVCVTDETLRLGIGKRVGWLDCDRNPKLQTAWNK